MRCSFVMGLILIAAVSLTACRGPGISQFNTNSFWTTETQEDKARADYWDKFYGRKKTGPESEAWKDFYDVPGEQIPRAQHCGFWGGVQKNCRGFDAPNPTPNCDFYGNCSAAAAKPNNSLGW